MNRILYEASYIGNSKIFFQNVGVITVLFLGWICFPYIVERRQRKCEKKNDFEYILKNVLNFCFRIVFGISCVIMTIGMILAYNSAILGYKSGKYYEVEGKVENYTELKDGIKFTIDKIEFKVNKPEIDWGYNYWGNQCVITGDGQHLKIRYIPRSKSIVYIEEINIGESVH